MRKLNSAGLAVSVLLALGPVGVYAATPEKEETKKAEMKETKTTERSEERHESSKNKSESPAALQKEAKISMDKAREIALKQAPGKVESGELEREHGKLLYSFDIRNARGTIDEVQVNAIDGTIVAIEHESKAQEAAERKKEAKEHKPATKTTTRH